MKKSTKIILGVLGALGLLGCLGAGALLWVITGSSVLPGPDEFGTGSQPSFVSHPYNQPPTSEPAKQAPTLRLSGLDGNLIEISEPRDEPLVLIFWATWCPTCEMQMPEVDRLVRGGDVGASVHAVNIREGVESEEKRRQNIHDYLETNGHDYPVLLGDQETMDALGVQPIPTVVIVDRMGRLRYRGVGIRSADEIATLVEMVEQAS